MKNEKWIKKAYGALNKEENSIFIEKGISIPASYNGQIAALGVTIALNGLLPALAIYYQTPGKTTKCDKRKILELIASMLDQPQKFESAKELLSFAITPEKGEYLKGLQRDMIACSVALKQVVRTYELIDDGNE